ncbi:MAG: transcription-repair coupling factor [Bacilli bacterium]|nr:transcription-repair coupling factor [Bacilli bacterium]
MDETIGTGLLFAALYKEQPDNYVIVSNNLYGAQKTYEFLLNFLKEEEVVFFPADELLRAESLSSSNELMSQRLYAMGQLQNEKKKILVTHPAALLRYLPNPKKFKSHTIHLKKNGNYKLEDLKSSLLEMGYKKVNKIDQSLEFASRGDILDIYSVNYLKPIRIEFFDTDIESIRFFDIATQSSVEEIEEIDILPATDLFLDDDEINSFVMRINDQLDVDLSFLNDSQREILKQHTMVDLENIVGRNYRPGLYKYMGFAVGEPYSITSYFDYKLCFVSSKEAFTASTQLLDQESRAFLNELHQNQLIPSHLEVYMGIDKALAKMSKVFFGQRYVKGPDDSFFNVRKIISAGTGIASLVPTVNNYLASTDKLVISLNDNRQLETVKSFLENSQIPYQIVDGFTLPEGKLGLATTPLNSGFEIPDIKVAYISSSEIFGQKVANSRFSSRFKEATILKTYEDLQPGDYVVHEYKGIGQFAEIMTMEVDGLHRDYIKIIYANNQVLYVPLEQLHLIRKYSGREGYAPKLSSLFGNGWKKKKQQIKEKMSDLADRLISLYGERTKIEGFAFPPDDEFQERFEQEFPYQLTLDQQKSLDEIKEDMEKPEIMDRLLCGDVGFGKTEIAFRAAFKAISAGKQVALLCPTTLLARQHYEVALQRFANFGVHIAQLSRLVPTAVQKVAIKEIDEGKIHLVIGTHRLLSKEIHFKDLGLLIVDEEQRFGVEQKEKIKELKSSVDVLTLSATPIPRTMQMSLVGIRPLSQINTAPEARMPIQTYVTPYSEDVAYELISRELARDGQVFYVHNKIASIYSRSSYIARNVPSAKVGVVHGQMEKEEIEDVMAKFYDKEINVLVCTSIVENGIDIPNANMIIVEDADRFGLAQLYQIKGRVGRGDKIAYAYLMYKPYKDLNDEAQKRLKAIQEFTELGSGYKIAQRDLMIRGAGDILGSEQAGFIDTIGLDLYMKLLNDAIEEKKAGKPKEPPKPKKLFKIDAYIPQGYAINSDKVGLYQELDAVKDEKELRAFSKHMRDMYGKMPEEVKLLIKKKSIDIFTESEEFTSVEDYDTYVDINLSDTFSRINGIGVSLFERMTPYLKFIRVSFVEKRLRIRYYKQEKWLDHLEEITNLIHVLYLKHLEG